MAHYFGFLPTDKLNQMIDEANRIVDSGEKTDYYPYRNALAQQLARELIDNMLVNLVEIIPNPERKESMKKIIHSIEGSTETLLKVLLGKDKNKDVIPSFNFMKDKSLFVDNEGNRRIGFELDESTAQKIMAGFDAVTPEAIDIETFKNSLETMNAAVLDHFITDFVATLKLGLIKRKAVPVAKVAINKGLSMAINKLFPQLPDDALNRLANFYRPYIVKLDK